MSGVRIVYLAAPIDQAKAGGDLVNMKQNATTWLKQLGIGLYRPDLAFQIPPDLAVGSEITEVNQYAVLQCGGMLALLPAGVPSVGVPMEIGAARSYGKPVAVVSDAPSWELQRDGIERFPWSYEGLRRAVNWLHAHEGGPVLSGREKLPTRLLAGGRLPTRAHDDDAGLDLYVSEQRNVAPGEFVDVPCGVAVELPPGTWGYLTGRSSTLRKRGLLVNPGVIDAGYRGPLFAGVWNLGSDLQVVEAGDRIAQLIVIGNQTAEVEPVEVDELGEHARGEAGFGSSGA